MKITLINSDEENVSCPLYLPSHQTNLRSTNIPIYTENTPINSEEEKVFCSLYPSEYAHISASPTSRLENYAFTQAPRSQIPPGDTRFEQHNALNNTTLLAARLIPKSALPTRTGLYTNLNNKQHNSSAAQKPLFSTSIHVSNP